MATTETGLSGFDAAVRRTPDAPAIHYLDDTSTWRDIDAMSRRFAGWLVEAGLDRGDRVAIWLQNVPEFVVALLGIWRAGCVAVPVNPMLRRKEVTHQLTDSGAKVLVGEDGLVAELTAAEIRKSSSVHTVLTTSAGGSCADLPFQQALQAAALDDTRVPGAADLAFLVYTSGTTGLPKAAMNTHANVAYNSRVYEAWMDLGANDVILGGAPLFHITGLVGGVGASHAAGRPLVLFYRFRAELCLRMIRQWRATFTVLPSTAIRALLDSPEFDTATVASLTKLYSGGAPIPRALAEEWQARAGSQLHSIYGLTETTSPTHAAPLHGPVRHDADSGLLSVGVGVPGVTTRVVDEHGAEVAPGALGEIWVKGPMVVPGYWNRPDATASSITDGFLHTGDVGSRDADGWCYVVDRIKDMINASGFKVWPREVEDTLLGHPAIAEAAVVGVPDDYRGETVKAFVRLRAGREARPADIIAWAREQMAAYKYPRFVEIVPELPKTASGKILRRNLR